MQTVAVQGINIRDDFTATSYFSLMRHLHLLNL